jgi:hypothetical protein
MTAFYNIFNNISKYNSGVAQLTMLESNLFVNNSFITNFITKN